MFLEQLKYREFAKRQREWSMDTATFSEINLIVGKNASGKSRLLNVIYSLASLLNGSNTKLYEDGTYEAIFSDGEKQFHYFLELKNYEVQKERLTIDGKNALNRGTDGRGSIFNDAINRDIDFQAPPGQVVVATRRDAIQHPFFDELYDWASSVRLYKFGSPFGQLTLKQIQQDELEEKSKEITNPDHLIEIFSRGNSEFPDKFKKAILKDLNTLGFECIDIKVMNISKFLTHKNQILALAVQEKSLKSPTIQISMSQGMYRALALFIHLNYMQFRGKKGCILIDDIGEGLDFGRSSSLIQLLIDRASIDEFQLIMTSNDRFVMNGVDLKHWSILLREGHDVRIFNRKNSPAPFAEFEYVGLNNFDFFTSEYFLGKSG